MARAYHAAVSGHTQKLRRLCGVICLLVACGGSPTREPAKRGPAPQAGPPPATDPVESAPSKTEASKPRQAMAQVRDDVPLPLAALLGKSVADVQAQLGEHLGKGMMRQHCVRYVPERTFFKCKYALQQYADKTGNFTLVQVIYEDGVATAVAFDGWKHATGPFAPEAALANVGLTLPEPGKESSPAPNVRLWSWFNARARLLIDGKQYRVEVSAVDDKWEHSRVEVSLNHPLTPEQKAAVVPAGPDASEPAVGAAPAP